MPDPRKYDERYPNRPKHEHFVILSESAQAHDAMSEQLDINPFEVAGVDEKSFTYFVRNRMGRVSEHPSGITIPPSPAIVALYLDAFAIGKAFAERLRENEEGK